MDTRTFNEDARRLGPSRRLSRKEQTSRVWTISPSLLVLTLALPTSEPDTVAMTPASEASASDQMQDSSLLGAKWNAEPAAVQNASTIVGGPTSAAPYAVVNFEGEADEIIVIPSSPAKLRFDQEELRRFEAVTDLDPVKAEQAVGSSGVERYATTADHPGVLPQMGRLRIASDPQVAVFEGSVRLGWTPLTVELPEGRHVLQFALGPHLRSRKTYNVRAGKIQKDQLYFGVTHLEVIAPDGAVIVLDGIKLGTAPLPPQEIYEGGHKLQVVYKDAQILEKLELPPGQTLTYRVAL